MVRLFEPGMVKRRAEPIGGSPRGVAGYAGGRILRGDVIRHAATERWRALPGRDMAAIAIGVGRRQSVVVADVARSARGGYVRARQCPTGAAVIELAVGPEERVVTGRTLRGREARSDVIRNIAAQRLRALPSGDVAAVTVRVRRREGVVVVGVAVRASHHFACGLKLMRSRQRPPCSAVIEDSRGPRDGVMTSGAVCRCKGCSRCRMCWIIRRLPRRQVTLRIPAIRRRNLEVIVVVDVAGCARRCLSSRRKLVRVRQRKAC